MERGAFLDGAVCFISAGGSGEYPRVLFALPEVDLDPSRRSSHAVGLRLHVW
jgi:hypothetical protein